MRSTLIDAGPLIALFDHSDQYHEHAIDFLKGYQGKLITTWPVITETFHMISFSSRVQINLLEWINRGGLQIFDIEYYHVTRLIELSEKFTDVPMDLADASLIIASEATSVTEIASMIATSIFIEIFVIGTLQMSLKCLNLCNPTISPEAGVVEFLDNKGGFTLVLARKEFI